jgi:hypothetical protein
MLMPQRESEVMESNLSGKSFDFSVGNASVIIDIFRNRLYGNKIQTLVQEYLCNARDACRELCPNGSDYHLRIHVQLPQIHDPVFKVRDFGVGLSPDRFVDVFLRYGESTKRSTEKQTGGFGLGAKSAWAYSDSFTIKSFFNGRAITYVAHIASKNEGTADVLFDEETTESNGVEISIPVHQKDFGDFINAYTRATYLWKKRPEVVRAGKDPDEKLGGLDKPGELPCEKFTLYKGDGFFVQSKVANVSHIFANLVFDVDGIPYSGDGLNNGSLDSADKALFDRFFTAVGKCFFVSAKQEQLEILPSREGFSNKQAALELVREAAKKFEKHLDSLLKGTVLVDSGVPHRKLIDMLYKERETGLLGAYNGFRTRVGYEKYFQINEGKIKDCGWVLLLVRVAPDKRTPSSYKGEITLMNTRDPLDICLSRHVYISERVFPAKEVNFTCRGTHNIFRDDPAELRAVLDLAKFEHRMSGFYVCMRAIEAEPVPRKEILDLMFENVSFLKKVKVEKPKGVKAVREEIERQVVLHMRSGGSPKLSPFPVDDIKHKFVLYGDFNERCEIQKISDAINHYGPFKSVGVAAVAQANLDLVAQKKEFVSLKDFFAGSCKGHALLEELLEKFKAYLKTDFNHSLFDKVYEKSAINACTLFDFKESKCPEFLAASEILKELKACERYFHDVSDKRSLARIANLPRPVCSRNDVYDLLKKVNEHYPLLPLVYWDASRKESAEQIIKYMKMVDSI